MDRGDVLSGAAFKAVLRSSFVFLVIITITALFSVRMLEQGMTDEVRLRVLEMERSLTGLAGSTDPVRLVGGIETVSRGASGQTLAYALYTADGTQLAGNIEAELAPGEWRTISAVLETQNPGQTSPEPSDFLLHAIQVGDMTLVAGRSLRIVSAVKQQMIRGFALTGFLVVLAMLGIGYLLSRRSQLKLEQIETVLERVAGGEIGARVAPGPENDQIDRISAKIDAQLAQLDDLMQNTRRTAASVAHDLRRPLARVTLGLEKALARAEAGEDARGEIEDALAGLGRLTGIITTILRIARIEGQGTGGMQDVDLRPILDEIAETFAPVAEDAGQTFVYARPDDPVTVRGDREMIAQLVVNLIQNAMSHAGPGARIAVNATSLASGTVLSVADDGPGIPEDLRAKVLEPFFRIDAARTDEGNGLGLVLIKAIADRHGARLELADAEPGLMVRVTFPASVSHK